MLWVPVPQKGASLVADCLRVAVSVGPMEKDSLLNLLNSSNIDEVRDLANL